MANFDSDLGRVEKFFLDVLANRLSEEQINTTVATFFGEQGAWYTVGWKMCVVIEKAFGRRTLIEVMCDQRKLLPTYNRAAARFNRNARKPLPLWSTSLIAAVTLKALANRAQGCFNPWTSGSKFYSIATLRGLHHRATSAARNSFRVATNLPGISDPRVSKQTLG